jgi:hypothetical protein
MAGIRAEEVSRAREVGGYGLTRNWRCGRSVRRARGGKFATTADSCGAAMRCTEGGSET